MHPKDRTSIFNLFEKSTGTSNIQMKAQLLLMNQSRDAAAVALPGYGLHCHRAVITLCKLIGIRDMYCKVEGSVNLLNITRALFNGLANQVRL